VLPLAKLVASLEVFLNAHLAVNHANRVSVIASHIQRAEFLHPADTSSICLNHSNGNDIETTDRSGSPQPVTDDANFYRPFAQLKAALDSSLTGLMRNTNAIELEEAYTTSLAGALTLALTYTNKLESTLAASVAGGSTTTTNAGNDSSSNGSAQISSRILVISVSPTSPNQYIPLMNTVFAAQRLRIPIDVLSIPTPTFSLTAHTSNGVTPLQSSSDSFLQQAADATSGIFLPLEHPHGLLQTLFLSFLPSSPSRDMLVMPAQQGVDFRAACFCHRKVIDVGYVCSVCLSIFCEPPQAERGENGNAEVVVTGRGGEIGMCLTCGTSLKMAGEGWGRKPVVVPPKRKKRRPRDEAVA